MDAPATTLTDTFGRRHDYLRISLTERCNMRCTYCMPEEGIPLRPREQFMRQQEVLAIAEVFTGLGVRKVRLTGGEPLVRNDAEAIVRGLARLPVELAITTNGVLVDRFIPAFHAAGLRKVNVSLDSLRPERVAAITRRDHYQQVMGNIELLHREGFDLKVNVVLLRGVNDDEIGDFVQWGADHGVPVRFIEFMPFDGNRWNMERTVPQAEVLRKLRERFGEDALQTVPGEAHDTARHYRLRGATATFGIIASVSNPFCDTCNRLRLTADGKLKNCLFAGAETDLLTAHRRGEDIAPLILRSVLHKARRRGGMEDLEQLSDPAQHGANRAMVAIGG
ncbi:MAG: GTP 3',8-cyclase MoaA [Flavobacteriales bacterium]|nr:GTP 3',8-cyclase 1 [Flavobacteriales bacterium]MCC6578508.1 GTP 3',8-cyclase MoaA [Flavobacteriales bacterium]NUQ15050.1 GTP 3',8-cyclase MoaA [Flavobacteriales bacterium]